MGLGLGIFLMAVGLILALGVRDRLADFDLSVIGWVLTGVGALAVVLSLIITIGRGPRRTEMVERRDDYDNPP
ncbi:DUF6458 family protein [Phytoactinopolyspora halotolerans]|uniref:DUF6458 domain-containing protein n=1 Tax=Phytoactinopolyspora halotolerans TaxID=1981512 RepID=A0A6L9SAP5_9ACTN|nr:DUF6458 family protein [Phytoactinopolyspora halotolerans]NEE02159.1 hypothetical protein [Phytoactinopolyspora halotolerans]